MARARAGEQRRVRLELSRLTSEEQRLAHERDLLQLELAAIVRRPGGSGRTAEAIALEQRIWPIIRAWERVSEQIRALKQEQWSARNGE
jgi:hypothetical protein